MNLSDAVKSIIKPHEEDTLTPLSTIFGEALDKSNILSEYPRPQMVRQSHQPERHLGLCHHKQPQSPCRV